MASYQIGERVWALSGDQWWPAKVVLGSIYNITHSPHETVVRYYTEPGTEGDDFDVLLDEQLTPYEESSSKAATLDALLLQAMDAAKLDSEALPLRDAPTAIGSKRSREEGGAASRHHRKEKHHSHEEASSAGAAAPTPKDTSSSTRAVTIIRIQADLHRATAANDIISARRCLLKLANERMTYAVLRETKIGVSVANLLGLEAFKSLYPLVKAIVSDWAGKLPEKTIEAIKHELDVSTLS